jgi:hypothetical protein
LLVSLFEKPDPDTLIRVITESLDRKASDSAWVTALGKQGVSVGLWPCRVRHCLNG